MAKVSGTLWLARFAERRVVFPELGKHAWYLYRSGISVGIAAQVSMTLRAEDLERQYSAELARPPLSEAKSPVFLLRALQERRIDVSYESYALHCISCFCPSKTQVLEGVCPECLKHVRKSVSPDISCSICLGLESICDSSLSILAPGGDL